MSKAEGRAIEKYPVEMYEEVGWRCVDKNTYKRQYFVEGYHQAEKDLELTWEDMFTIFHLINEVLDDYADGKTKKEVGEEVLERFLNKRKEK